MDSFLVIPPADSFRPVNKLTPESIILLEQGLALWETGKYDHIIVSGGIINPRQIQQQPGGLIFQKWFIKHRVRPEKILVDTTARDIYEGVDRMVELVKEDDCHLTLVGDLIQFLRIYLICKIKHNQKKLKLFCKKSSTIRKTSEVFWLLNTLIDPTGQGYFAREYRWRRTIL